MPGARPTVSAEQVAVEAGVPVSYVVEIVDAGVLRPVADGRHDLADVSLVRLAQALAEGGIPSADLAWAMDSEELELAAQGYPGAGTARTSPEPARDRLLTSVAGSG